MSRQAKAETHASDQVKRLLQRGDAKQALKDAKVLARREPTSENRQLLHEAALARATQLQKAGLLDQAKAVIAENCPSQSDSSELGPALAHLRLALGLGNTSAATESSPESVEALADEAVLKPARLADHHQALKLEAERVRLALAAVERGEDSAAAEILQPISHKSPMAEWKLLVRGLIAHYEFDDERRDANWQRLNPRRAAHRIAEAVRASRDSRGLPEDSRMAERVRRLTSSTRPPLAGELATMAQHARKGEWSDVVRLLTSARGRLRGSFPEIIERATELVWKALAAAGRVVELDALLSRVGPLPLDPGGHRARALCFQHAENDGDPFEFERKWQAFLANPGELRPEEAALVDALVKYHVACYFASAATHLLIDAGYRDDDDDENNAEDFQSHLAMTLHSKGLALLRGSVKSYPKLLKAHQALNVVLWQEDAKAAAVQASRELLENFPDHLPTILQLARYYLERDEPEMAETYAAKARQLQPRAREVQRLEVARHLSLLRRAVWKDNIEEARRLVETMAGLAESSLEPFAIDVLRAGVEFRAKHAETAERILAEAAARVANPAPVWLYMRIVADRYKLHAKVKSRFGKLFETHLREAPTTEVAGSIARVLYPYSCGDVTYTGFLTHAKRLLTYAKKVPVRKWALRDLRDVCAVLDQLRPGNCAFERGLRTLAATGQRWFPRDPGFPYYAAMTLEELSWGNFMPAFQLTQLLRRALDRNEQAEIPLSDRQLEDAREKLSALPMGLVEDIGLF